MLSKRVAVWEIFLRERFVHDYDLRGIFSVAPIEDTACQQRNAHGAKIIASHSKIRSVWMIALSGVRTTNDPEGICAVVAGERQWRCSADCFDSGQCRQLRQEAFEELALLFRLRVFCSREDKVGGHDLRGIESGISRAQIPEALDQQTGAGQEQSDNATCETTRMLRRRCDSRLAPPRFPSCNDAFTFGRVTCNAGTSAKSNVLITATPTV